MTMAKTGGAMRAFVRNFSTSKPRLASAGATEEEQYKSYKMWKNISLFVALPVVALASVNVYFTHEHTKRPPFIKYEYMYIRTKRFPWGDGNHGLFHNPRVNALPDGYEYELDEDEHH